MLATLDRVVREADAVACFRLAADGGSHFVLIVKEGAEAYTQYAGYFDKRCQRGQVDVVFDAFNLFDGRPERSASSSRLMFLLSRSDLIFSPTILLVSMVSMFFVLSDNNFNV